MHTKSLLNCTLLEILIGPDPNMLAGNIAILKLATKISLGSGGAINVSDEIGLVTFIIIPL